MAKLLRTSLVLLAVAAIAPASANNLANSAAGHRWPCPEQRAELAAAGYEPVDALSVGDPADGSLFDPGRRSAFLP